MKDYSLIYILGFDINHIGYVESEKGFVRNPTTQDMIKIRNVVKELLKSNIEKDVIIEKLEKSMPCP